MCLFGCRKKNVKETSPFSALAGYDGMITAPLTGAETMFTEGDIGVLNRKPRLILWMIGEKLRPEIPQCILTRCQHGRRQFSFKPKLRQHNSEK